MKSLCSRGVSLKADRTVRTVRSVVRTCGQSTLITTAER